MTTPTIVATVLLLCTYPNGHILANKMQRGSTVQQCQSFLNDDIRFNAACAKRGWTAEECQEAKTGVRSYCRCVER